MKKIHTIIPIVILLLLSSCLEDPAPDPAQIPKDEPPYRKLKVEEFEWLDLEGFWVYHDSIEGKIDTITGNSAIRKRIAWRQESLGEMVINHYYDKITLSLYNTFMFNNDSTMKLTITSMSFHTNWPGGIVYGDVTSSYPSILNFWTRIFDLNETPVSVNDYNNVIRSKSLYFLPEYTFYLAKGIGIVKVDYDDNDSTNSITLVDYSVY